MKISKYPGFPKNEKFFLTVVLFLPIIANTGDAFPSSSFWVGQGVIYFIIFFVAALRWYYLKKYSKSSYRFDASLAPKSAYGKFFMVKMAVTPILAMVLVLGIFYLFPKSEFYIPVAATLALIIYLVINYFKTKNEEESNVSSLRIFENKLIVIKNYFVNEFELKDISSIKIDDSNLVIEEQADEEIILRHYDVSGVAVWHLNYFKQNMNKLLSNTPDEISGELNPII